MLAQPQQRLDDKWSEIEKNYLKRVQHQGIPSACWECQYATTGTGYCQLNLNGSGYGVDAGNYSVHLWSMVVHKKMQPLGLKDPDCSHLCHNKRCCNPDHMVWEEGKNNKKRNQCPHVVGGVLMCKYIHAAPTCLAPHSRFESNGVCVSIQATISIQLMYSKQL